MKSNIMTQYVQFINIHDYLLKLTFIFRNVNFFLNFLQLIQGILGLIGWVYVFYVGHIDRMDYMKPFSILQFF
jgi:hypothetical protein